MKMTLSNQLPEYPVFAEGIRRRYSPGARPWIYPFAGTDRHGLKKCIALYPCGTAQKTGS